MSLEHNAISSFASTLIRDPRCYMELAESDLPYMLHARAYKYMHYLAWEITRAYYSYVNPVSRFARSRIYSGIRSRKDVQIFDYRDYRRTIVTLLLLLKER